MAKKQDKRLKAEHGLNERQREFCRYYAKEGNVTQAAIKAGYSKKTAAYQGSNLLNNPKIVAEILRLNRPAETRAIADAQEVMEFFTKGMRGEIKDQFGLDPSLGDRTKCAVELAKRTVDLENRARGQADQVVEIKVDWHRDTNGQASD